MSDEDHDNSARTLAFPPTLHEAKTLHRKNTMRFVHNQRIPDREPDRRFCFSYIASSLLLCLAISMPGCGDNPGTRSLTEVARRIKRVLKEKGLKVTDVTVTAKPERDLAGWSHQSEGTGHLVHGFFRRSNMDTSWIPHRQNNRPAPSPV